MTNRCSACGTGCSSTAQFCPGCGIRLGGTSSAGPTATLQSGLYDLGIAVGGATPLPPGTLLQGRYRIERVLGTGAFGRVYFAQDLQDAAQPPVAIKELLDAQFSTPEEKHEAVMWFKREASTLLALEHPGIPAMYTYWTAQHAAGPFYLAMEYVPGQTLENVLQDAGGRVAWKKVVAWGLALCDVLSYLHSRTPPVVFRDLKLANIMLNSATNAPVLIDFGIARQLTPSGTAIGTWGYVPMEQVLGHADPRSDIYALGATLHALLTGRHPDAEYTRLLHSGQDVEGAMRALFPAVDTLVPGVPAWFGQVLTKASAFAVADRYDDAASMAAALRHISRQNNGAMPPVVRAPISTPQTPVSPVTTPRAHAPITTQTIQRQPAHATTVIAQPSRPTHLQSTTKDAGVLPLGALVVFFFSSLAGVFFLWLCRVLIRFGLSSSATAFFIVILLVLFGTAVASGWSVILHRRNW